MRYSDNKKTNQYDAVPTSDESKNQLDFPMIDQGPTSHVSPYVGANSKLRKRRRRGTSSRDHFGFAAQTWILRTRRINTKCWSFWRTIIMVKETALLSVVQIYKLVPRCNIHRLIMFVFDCCYISN